jgi:hypothetical protein
MTGAQRRLFERPFTDPASIRRLQACLNGGMHKQRIAQRFGCDPDCVDRAIAKFGLKRPGTAEARPLGQMRKLPEAQR